MGEEKETSPSPSEIQEISGCRRLSPGVYAHFKTRKPAGGYLVNEIQAKRIKEIETQGFIGWKPYEQVVLRNGEIIRKIDKGTDFLTLIGDIKIDQTDKRRIVPMESI